MLIDSAKSAEAGLTSLEEMEHVLQQRLLKHFGEEIYNCWFKSIKLEAIDDRVVTASVALPYQRRDINHLYFDDVVDIVCIACGREVHVVIEDRKTRYDKKPTIAPIPEPKPPKKQRVSSAPDMTDAPAPPLIQPAASSQQKETPSPMLEVQHVETPPPTLEAQPAPSPPECASPVPATTASKTRRVDRFDILLALMKYYQLSIQELTSKSISRRISTPRQIGMYLMRDLTTCSYRKISTVFGYNDHSMALQSCRRVANRVLHESHFREEVEHVRAFLLDSIKT